MNGAIFFGQRRKKKDFILTFHQCKVCTFTIVIIIKQPFDIEPQKNIIKERKSQT